MSFSSEILQLFGTSSVPVVVAGTVLGVFELGERLASQPAKDALAKWLLTFDVRDASVLPGGTREFFQKIFGERHFSWKCLMRSAAFSLGAMAFIGLIMFLLAPQKVLPPEKELALLIIGLWLPWSLLVDYVSLFKTRIILGLLMRVRRAWSTIAILMADYLFYRVIYAVGMAIVAVAIFWIRNWQVSDGLYDEIWNSFGQIMYDFVWTMPLLVREIELPSLFFWAGFAPSIWLWFYVLALFVTRALLRSEKLIRWLRWFLDVEKNPFRSIGAVAAALAFIASVAIILVSLEIARIGGAT